MQVKSLLFLAAFFFMMLPSWAQSSFSISGIVADSSTGTPLELCTVTLRQQAAGPLSKMVTSKDGSFRFQKLPAGRYEVIIEQQGYAVKNLFADVDSSKGEANLGTIMLPVRAKTLGEVTVTARKPLVTQEIDRIIYNIQGDPDSKAFNMFDMMRKVPFVSVTPDDQLQINGSGNFRILLDGKTSSMFASRNLRDVLKGIPASDILRIEVITTPPARYESEGLAGIINIITNRKLKDGYNGSANVNYSRLLSGVSGSLNGKKGKFGFTTFNGLSREHTPDAAYTLELLQQHPVMFRFQQSGQRRFTGDQAYFNAMMSYELDTLNLFTGNIGYNSAQGRHRNVQQARLWDNAGALNQSYSLLANREDNDRGWDAALNYQRGFRSNKNRLLTFSYRHVSTASQYNYRNGSSNKFNYAVGDLQQENNSGLAEQSVQVDYVHPVKKVTAEGGAKWIHRDQSSSFLYQLLNESTDQFETDPSRSQAFRYGQQVFSFYNSYLVKLKALSFRAGYRYEATRTSADFRQGGGIFRHDYSNLVPSLTVLLRLNSSTTATVAYTQRVQRPGISLLNPFVDESDPRFRRSGNPNLQPVLMHTMNATFSRLKASTLTAGLSYVFSRNTIQALSTSPASDSIIYVSYRNIGQYDKLGTNINLSFPLGKHLTLTANGTLSHVWVAGVIEEQAASNSGWEGFAYSYLSLNSVKDWRFSVNAGYYGPVRNLQGNSNGYFYSSFNASRNVMKQKGTLALSVSNPFQEYRTVRTLTESADFTQELVSRNYFRNVNVSFNYRFGKLKEEIRKNRRSINNDDKVNELLKVQ
jgi:hypothetical protein